MTLRVTKGWSKGQQFVPRTPCITCGKPFYAPPAQRKRGGGQYCSRQCYGVSRTTDVHTRTCAKCATQFSFPAITKRPPKRCPDCRPTKERCPGAPCKHCGLVASKLFCNAECYKAYRHANQTPRQLATNSLCQKCGASFYSSPGHKASGWGKYCSLKCRKLPGYGRGKGGIRDDLGLYVRSTWEANYARYLNFLLARSQIADWRYEPDTFQFHSIKRGTRFYTPDFKITNNDGSIVYHEVKGYMDAKSQTKLSRMAKYYPNVTVIMIRNKEMREIKAKLAPLIPNWEHGTNDKL